MANIDKELNQIKNAVYGREVRGSIHDGIEKINKESEDSREKATEAHEVMESIMTEGFDNAALEANFEQKLDDKIANLQPEWTEFRKDTEQQIMINKNYTGIPQKEMYKREIVLELPGRFDDYDQVMMGQYGYMHAQAFTVHDGMLFVLYVPNDASTLNSRWIAVYDWNTGNYISCFGVVSEGWEGIVVKKENSQRFLYVGHRKTSEFYDLHRYDITKLPSNMDLLMDYDVVLTNIYHRFNYHDGKWVVIKARETVVGDKGSRSLWQILDHKFNVIKNIRVDEELRNLLSVRTSDAFPKVQGLGIGSDFLVLSLGRSTEDGNFTDRDKQQGILLLDNDGNVVKRGMMDYRLLLSFYKQIGYNPQKIENEGVWVDKNDDIYTLNVIDTSNKNNGILIIKEGSSDKNSIDFGVTATHLHSVNPIKYSGRYYPLVDGYYKNPLTGQRIRTVTEMIDFARKYDLPEIKFYISDADELVTITGKQEKYIYYHFWNATGDTFFGMEHSLDGLRHVFSNTTSTRYVGILNGINLIDKPKEIKINEIINFDIDVDFNKFNQMEIVLQPNGYGNVKHQFSLERGSKDKFEIRTFNMSDKNNAVIVFYEITLQLVDGGIKLIKHNRHVFSGSNVDKELDNRGTLTISNVSVY